MKWLDFEHEIRDLVEEFGYAGLSTPPSGDYGVDVIAEKKNKKVVIQCKLYGKGSIGGDHIMKLVGSKGFFGATDAICFTTSRFTKQAREIASKSNVHLVDRDILLSLCKDSKLTIPSLTYLVNQKDIHSVRFDTVRSVT
ncbi:MAG: restriction endonuclease [Armatimonas sp.]